MGSQWLHDFEENRLASNCNHRHFYWRVGIDMAWGRYFPSVVAERSITLSLVIKKFNGHLPIGCGDIFDLDTFVGWGCYFSIFLWRQSCPWSRIWKLRRVSLNWMFRNGRFFDHGVTALCGPSGSGKTTLFRTLLGLEPDRLGSFLGCTMGLTWFGCRPERQLGVVFQNLSSFPHMSCLENIEFVARARKWNPVFRDRMEHMITKLVAGCRERPRPSVVRWRKQRVALARALIGKTK